VLGTQPIRSTDSQVTWALEAATALVGQEGPQLILSIPADDEEDVYVGINKSGVYEVAFWVDKGRERGCAKTPYGKIVWIPRV